MRYSNAVRRHRSSIRLSFAAAVLAVLVGVPGVSAQEPTGAITGVVTTDTGEPVIGAQVTVADTLRATVTNASGTFTFTGLPVGEYEVRVVSLGYHAATEPVEVVADQTARVEFRLSVSAIALDEVVVTALGIEREARSLTTATQQVSGAALTEVRDANLVTALTGKVSGVQIVNSNTPGGSARIVIRGASSITGDNQPLFVVDGVPVSNRAGFGGSFGYNGIDYGNAISEINPDNIESISVLKGPNAAALYGSRAANGAIIITTKRGQHVGGQVTASTNVTFQSPLKLPEYQNEYGQGYNGEYMYVDGAGNGLYDDRDESWGRVWMTG